MSLYRLTKIWKQADELVREERGRRFLFRSVVYVNQPGRYIGFGIVDSCSDVPPDKVAVLLENGNTWHYETDYCAPNDNPALWPRWITRLKRSWAGKKAAATRRENLRGESH